MQITSINKQGFSPSNYVCFWGDSFVEFKSSEMWKYFWKKKQSVAGPVVCSNGRKSQQENHRSGGCISHIMYRKIGPECRGKIQSKMKNWYVCVRGALTSFPRKKGTLSIWWMLSSLLSVGFVCERNGSVLNWFCLFGQFLAQEKIQSSVENLWRSYVRGGY